MMWSGQRQSQVTMEELLVVETEAIFFSQYRYLGLLIWKDLLICPFVCPCSAGEGDRGEEM